MAFVFLTLVGMYVGRKLGWALSRAFLYSSSTSIATAGCFIWGCVVAYGVHSLIVWLHPYWILKVIFGFALGAYVAIPNFGLVMESSIPDHAVARHQLISLLPMWIYILASVGFAYLM